MKLLLIFCCFLLANCSKVKTASNKNGQTNSDETVSVSPIIKTDTTLKPIIPKIKLNSKQKKYLDKALPPQVREILEKAERFEILAEVRGENEYYGEGTTFEPNRIANITDEKNKKQILEVYYSDVATDESPANCYIPRHKIRAIYQDKIVEIEICFECARFEVDSSFGNFYGTIVRENRKSENFFDQIIKNKSVEIK